MRIGEAVADMTVGVNLPVGAALGQLLAKIVLSIILVPPLVQLFVTIGRKLDADSLS